MTITVEISELRAFEEAVLDRTKSVLREAFNESLPILRDRAETFTTSSKLVAKFDEVQKRHKMPRLVPEV